MQPLLLALQLAFVTFLASGQVLPHDPLDHLQAHLATVDTEKTSPWKEFVVENTSQKVKAMQASFPNKAASGAASVLFFHEDKCLVRSLASGLEWNSTVTVPSAVVLAIASATLPILLEGYEAATFNDPIKTVLADKDYDNHAFKEYLSASLRSLLTALPAESNMEDTSQLDGLGARGKVVVQFSEALQGRQGSAEAWRDALMSVGMEDSSFNDQRGLVTTLKHVTNFGVAMTHLLQNAQGARMHSTERLPLAHNRYLFGWWLNCARDQQEGEVECLLPILPRDTIFSVSPTLRVYVSPSLSLSLLVLNSQDESRRASVMEILEQDRNIWQHLYSTLVPSGEDRVLNEAKDNWLAMMWSLLWFLFFILSSHLWVYWLFHIAWYCLTAISKRAHIPRPKTAKEE